MRVPFMDLRVDEPERRKYLSVIDTVLQHGQLILGPEVSKLEDEIGRRIGNRHAVGVGSGTDALLLSLLSLDIGHGDEVITSPLSFIATANAIALAGARPVFVDVGNDLNIDPSMIERAITPRTKAILPVHYCGFVSDMDAICRIADRHGLPVIEDAAQSFYAERSNRLAGTWGTMACFSMNPMKVFGAVGESGMIVTDSLDLKQKIIALRYNGLVDRKDCHYVSLNGRIDTIQAAVLLERLGNVDEHVRRRVQIAEYYNEFLKPYVALPEGRNGRGTYFLYAILSGHSVPLHEFLKERGVETQFPHRLIPDMKAYKKFDDVGIENARRLHPMLLNLPCNEKMRDEQMEYVAESVKAYFEEHQNARRRNANS